MGWETPPPPLRVAQSRRRGPRSGLGAAARQTEIRHFQAVENVKFPCSGQEPITAVRTRWLLWPLRPPSGSGGVSDSFF